MNKYAIDKATINATSDVISCTNYCKMPGVTLTNATNDVRGYLKEWKWCQGLFKRMQVMSRVIQVNATNYAICKKN